jgi:hypothetical protein
MPGQERIVVIKRTSSFKRTRHVLISGEVYVGCLHDAFGELTKVLRLWAGLRYEEIFPEQQSDICIFKHRG